MAKTRNPRTAKPKGLGDLIAMGTDALGIEKCEGCEKRQEKLNDLFPFGKKQHVPYTDEQKEFLTDLFSKELKDITPKQQEGILDAYRHAFQNKTQQQDICTGCSGVWKKILNDLKKTDYTIE